MDGLTDKMQWYRLCLPSQGNKEENSQYLCGVLIVILMATERKGIQLFIKMLRKTKVDLDIVGRLNDINNFGVISHLVDCLSGQIQKGYEN